MLPLILLLIIHLPAVASGPPRIATAPLSDVRFSASELSAIVGSLPFDGEAYLRSSHGERRDGFQHHAESWMQTLWALITRQLPAGLLRAVGAASNASSTCTNSSHCDLGSSMFARLPVPQSFTRHPGAMVCGLWNCTVPERRSNGMTIMSGGDRDPHGTQNRVIQNHRDFAERRGYTYWWHQGSLVEEKGWQPYWSKIAQLRESMRRRPQERAYIWIDDDIVLTNFGEDMFETALDRYSNASVLVTKDAWPGVSSLNTGIIIVRNDDRAAEILDELLLLAMEPREDGVSLAHASQTFCLHEQEALASVMKRSRCGTGGIAVLPQRAATPDQFNLNTFLRWSHLDRDRGLDQQFVHDSRGSQWRHGDFAGHCTGLSYLRRGLCVRTLLSSVVDGVAEEDRTI